MKELIDLFVVVLLITGSFGIGYYFARQEATIDSLEEKYNAEPSFTAMREGLTLIIASEQAVNYCQRGYAVFDNNGDKVCGD